MKKKNICLILCHPSEKSFNHALSQNYIDGANQSGHSVRLLDLYNMQFDPVLRLPQSSIQADEPAILEARQTIKWCDHIVLVFPVWWYGLPALLKGFLDRVLAPGWAFQFDGPLIWRKLLQGRSARVICTMDSPPILAKLSGDPVSASLKAGTLAFVGFEPVSFSCFGPVKLSNSWMRKNWLLEAKDLGKRAS